MSEIERRLNRLCDGFRGRLKFLLFQAGLARAVAVAILLFGLLLWLDWWRHLDTLYRLPLLLVYLAAIGLTLWYTLFRPLVGRWSNRHVLAYVDRTVSGSKGMMLDLYELATAREGIQEVETETGRQFADNAVQAIEPIAAQVRLGEAFGRRRALRWMGSAAAFVLLLIGFGLLFPQHLEAGARRLFNPFSSYRWPHRTTILLLDPSTGKPVAAKDARWTVPQLESFTLTAEVVGKIPSEVTLTYRGRESKHEIPVPLPVEAVVQKQTVDGREQEVTRYLVHYEFPQISEETEFSLSGLDYETDEYSIGITRRPYIKNIDASFDYPAYAGIPNTTSNSGQLRGLEGTRVELAFEASMPLERAVFVLEEEGMAPAPPTPTGEAAEGDGDAPMLEGSAALSPEAKHIDLKRLDDRHFKLEMDYPDDPDRRFVLSKNGRYAVELYSAEGDHREAKPEIYDIRVKPDKLPQVELILPGRDLVQTKNAAVRVKFQAWDEFGLSQVGFFYQVDNAAPVALSDRVTGPIPQLGKRSPAEFKWDLARMEPALPESSLIRYFVRVRDNNPIPNREAVESESGYIKLVKESEFLLDALEQSKMLEEEARNAWRDQLHAYLRAAEWLKTGTGKPDDKIWDQMLEKQRKAFLATQQVQARLQDLTDKYRQNQMGRDFMAGRLSVIIELTRTILDVHHPPISEGLREARPKTEADAEPDRMKGIRGSVLTRQSGEPKMSVHDHQKMAVLVTERLLRKLYDWRDLMDSTVKARLLYEQQEEVHTRTQEIAPRYIGKDIKDLPDEQQEDLLTLGKQQTAIFDSESALEAQLTYLMFKAEKQKRQSIHGPLNAAFDNLRKNRVNYHLKRAAKMISNNQPSQILDNQKAAVRALQIVQAGLEQAGQKVDEDSPITLAMNITPEDQFDPDLIQVAAKPPDDTTSGDGGPEDIGPVVVPTITLPEGTDKLSAAIRLSIELQDNVRARTHYLSNNNGPSEMPRFIRLKLLRLAERQQSALDDGIDVAMTESQRTKDKEGKALPPVDRAVKEILPQVKIEFVQSQQLLADRQVNPTVQQIQADSIRTLEGLLQYVAMDKSVETATEENRRQNGVDAFGRQYLLQQKNLDVAVAALDDTNYAAQLQRDVLRKLVRFQAQAAPTQNAKLTAIEKSNRQRAADAQQKLAALITEGTGRASALSAEVLESVKQTGLATLGELGVGKHAAAIRDGKQDAGLAPPEPVMADVPVPDETKMTPEQFQIAQDAYRKAKDDYEKLYEQWRKNPGPLREAESQLTMTVQLLRDLLEERVKPPPEPPPQIVKIDPEHFKKLNSREHLAEMLKQRDDMPPEIRDRMVKALLRKKEFPKKYERLIKAYYANFVGEQERKEQE